MKSFSGKFVLRVPPKLHEKLAKTAFKKGLSLNGFVTSLIKGANFSRCVLEGAFMAEIHAEGALFRGAQMDDIFFQRGFIDGADFTGASLKDASIFMMRGEGAIFVNASLDDAKMLKCILEGATFKGASMENSSLKGSNIISCDFSEARLDNCDMRQVRSQGAMFNGAATAGFLFYGKKPWGEAADKRDWSKELQVFNDD